LIGEGTAQIIFCVGSKVSYGYGPRILSRLSPLFFLLVSGCRFSIGSVDVDAAVDRAPPITTPDDLASPPVVDMAVPPQKIVADMARPVVHDLSLPPDLGPICEHVTETFAGDPTSRWALMGNASWDGNGTRLQVTSPDLNVAGSAFYNHAFYTVGFDARFDFRIDDGSGADGLAFVLAHSASVAGLTPFGNGTPNAGYGLGYYGMAGFAVEFDTFMNIGNNDPDNNHVGFMRTSDGTHLLTGTPPAPQLHSAAVRAAHIRFTGTHVTVEIDGSKAIDADLPAMSNFAPGTYFFGFTGASGGATDRHTVSNFELTVGTPGVCF
jgi:hypothetical protein